MTDFAVPKGANEFSGAPPAETDGKQTYVLDRGTLAAALLAVLLAQMVLATPAVLNGLFQHDLATSSSQLTWISAAFLVPVTLFELTFGLLGDLFGRKRLLVIGAALMVVGLVISVLTPGQSASTGTRVAVLWIGQGITGIGAAALFPTSLAMVAAGTRTARDRGRVVAYWAAALSTGAFIAPVLGGLLTKLAWGSDPYASWRWAFLGIAVIAAISFIVSLLFARNSSAPEGRSLDWPGQVTIALALFALLFAVVSAANAGWGSTQVLVGFVVAAFGLAAFIAVERRHPKPLLRLDLFRQRSFAVNAVITVGGMFAMLGTAYTVSVRLTNLQGFSPLKSSLAFVLLNGACLLLVPLTARVLPRYNPRWLLAIGFAVMAIGDFWMSSLTAADRSLTPLIIPLIFVGIGFALTVSAVTAVAVNAVGPGLEGMASATTSMLRDLGFTLGPTLLSAITLSIAASGIRSKIAASPALTKALAGFYASPGHVPVAQQASTQAAVAAVKSGPLGMNSVPSTVTNHGRVIEFNPVQHVAFHALDHAFNVGFVVAGSAALGACLLALFGLGRDVAPHDIVDAADSQSLRDGATATRP